MREGCWGETGEKRLQEAFLHFSLAFLMPHFVKPFCFLVSEKAQGDQELRCCFSRCEVETKPINYYLKKIL